MSHQDYLISKALRSMTPRPVDKAFGRERIRSNEELTNAELNRRMKQQKVLKPVAGVAGQVVPGGASLAGTWDAERKFRIGRNAQKAEAREIQRREQHQRVAGAGVGAGVALSTTGIGRKKAGAARSIKGPLKFGVGAGLAGGSAYVSHLEGKKKTKVQEGVWNRVLARNPGGRE